MADTTVDSRSGCRGAIGLRPCTLAACGSRRANRWRSVTVGWPDIAGLAGRVLSTGNAGPAAAWQLDGWQIRLSCLWGRNWSTGPHPRGRFATVGERAPRIFRVRQIARTPCDKASCEECAAEPRDGDAFERPTASRRMSRCSSVIAHSLRIFTPGIDFRTSFVSGSK
jgi:hypothetical protein